MSTDLATVSEAESVGVTAGLERRMLRSFKAQVEDWYDVCRQLSGWEDRHLVDQASAQKLVEHARILDELHRVGQWLLVTASSSDFPDPKTADWVSMTLQDLRDRRSLWHGRLSAEERREIVEAVFDEP